MYVYLGMIYSGCEEYLVFDTICKQLEMFTDYELLKDAVQVGVMQAVCTTDYKDDIMILPYRDTYTKMVNFVSEYVPLWKKEVVRMKLMGEDKLSRVFKKFPMDTEYYTLEGRNGEIKLCSVENNLFYRISCDGGFEVIHGASGTLNDWEIIEILNIYGDVILENGIYKCYLCEELELSNYTTLSTLISYIFDMFEKDYDIGFLKRNTVFHRTWDGNQAVGTNNYVVKLVTEPDTLYICGMNSGGPYKYESCCNPENIVWLSHEIKENYVR
jgi:hypothetical protein